MPSSRLFRGLLLAALLPAGRVFAQALLDPAEPESAKAIEGFEQTWSGPYEPALKGSFNFIKPALGYNLRHWAGYDLLLRAAQFDLSMPLTFAVIFSVTPAAGGRPFYFFQRHNLQPPRMEEAALKSAAGRLQLHFSGGFFAGPGRYRFRLLLGDQSGRLYKREESFEVKAADGQSSLAPAAVASIGAPNWTGFAPDARGGRATILVHAAPVYPRRSVTRLQPYDRYVLLSALGTLLSRGGFSSARVIVLDLAGRRVLFDERNFNRGAMRRLGRQLEEADFATIDYQTLASGPSPQRLAESVLAEAARGDGDETVVFLGPAWMPPRRQQPIRPALKESLPKLHYLALVPRTLLPQDTIFNIVKSLKGRVYPIYEPSDLLNALRKIALGG
jgi:hypothetical protein